jgi:hypothetical protein
LRKLVYIRLGTYYADIVWICPLPLVRERNVLSDEHPYAYPRHVKAIEESLYVIVDLHPLPFPLPL